MSEHFCGSICSPAMCSVDVPASQESTSIIFVLIYIIQMWERFNLFVIYTLLGQVFVQACCSLSYRILLNMHLNLFLVFYSSVAQTISWMWSISTFALLGQVQETRKAVFILFMISDIWVHHGREGSGKSEPNASQERGQRWRTERKRMHGCLFIAILFSPLIPSQPVRWCLPHPIALVFSFSSSCLDVTSSAQLDQLH